ncbi:MAG: two-component sensor histidine kinase [Alkalinema sp. CACIAM 70d]|nr:MAG: two-component sensor histidine kinase [Alkalinema sp. CACIAM 70d]
MRQSQLFNRTRLQLAAWYASVMGVILSVFGGMVYVHMARSHFEAIDGELQTIAVSLRDRIQPVLDTPGMLPSQGIPTVPELCLVGQPCPSASGSSHLHVFGSDRPEPYYVRLTNLSSHVVATIHTPPPSPRFVSAFPHSKSQISLINFLNPSVHQSTILLKTATGEPWGYLQVGRSLAGYNQHLTTLKTILLVGLPIATLVIGGASWWLAGLAMRPVYLAYHQIQQFTADAAHELRTPLAALCSTVEVTLADADLTQENARTTLQTVERQALRLSQLVQDLLLLSKMDLQAWPQKLQRCCLNDLVSDLVEEYSALALASQVDLRSELPRQQMLYIQGDEEKIYRLLTNLIVNAIHYTPAAGRVTVALCKQDRYGVIQVQDTGIGIPIAQQARIFDRFYRVETDRSRRTGGSGLGLAIAQAIAQDHRGSIRVTSQVGRGSTFIVFLPLAKEGG